MKIGIVGVGMVGGALKFGFTRIGHEVLEHDVKLGTRLEVVRSAPIAFICVPTPSRDDGRCDTSLVEDVVGALNRLAYPGLVVIKSTVTPGTTDHLHRRHLALRLAFCPEFLRERARFSDFVENHEVCVVGTMNDADAALIQKAHGSLPKRFVQMPPLEAELTKYFANTLNALRIVFANQFWEVCQAVGADYGTIKNAASMRASVGSDYLDCNANFRAFGGACLPKDTAAFARFAWSVAPDVELFKQIVELNERTARVASN